MPLPLHVSTVVLDPTPKVLYHTPPLELVWAHPGMSLVAPIVVPNWSDVVSNIAALHRSFDGTSRVDKTTVGTADAELTVVELDGGELEGPTNVKLPLPTLGPPMRIMYVLGALHAHEREGELLDRNPLHAVTDEQEPVYTFEK